MSHLAFVAPPYLGHLHPTLALADSLVARGHSTTVFGIGDIADSVTSGGSRHHALGARSHPPGTLGRMAAHMARPHGLGFLAILGDMRRMTRMLCRELPHACRVGRVDAIVSDQLEPAGALVARHLGIPHVSVANALPIDRDPGVPPPFTDWRYDPSPRGLTRNRGGYRVADVLMRPLGRTLAAEAERLGIAPVRSLEDALSPAASVSQLVPELDYPRAPRPGAPIPCGPLRRPAEPLADPALLGDGRPLVFASLGTLQGGRLDLFRLIADACAAQDLHLVIAHGGRLTPAEVATLPGTPVVRDFVAQRALLAHAALAITNGGLNTVLDAAAAGVPLLVLPIAFEQGAIAARVEHAGVGAALPRRRLSRTRLADAVAALIADRGMRARCRALAAAMSRYGGTAAAADVVESVLDRRAEAVPLRVASA